jgi:hypothetical protein
MWPAARTGKGCGKMHLIRLPYALSVVLKPLSCLGAEPSPSFTLTSMGTGSDASLNSGLVAMQRSTKLRAGIKPFGDLSMQMVPPVITISTLASGVIPVSTLSNSGESMAVKTTAAVCERCWLTWNLECSHTGPCVNSTGRTSELRKPPQSIDLQCEVPLSSQDVRNFIWKQLSFSFSG